MLGKTHNCMHCIIRPFFTYVITVYLYRVGSCLPPLSIICLDEYENQIPFTSVPSLEVKLKASLDFEVPVHKIEANLIDDNGILKLKVSKS